MLEEEAIAIFKKYKYFFFYSMPSFEGRANLVASAVSVSPEDKIEHNNELLAELSTRSELDNDEYLTKALVPFLLTNHPEFSEILSRLDNDPQTAKLNNKVKIKEFNELLKDKKMSEAEALLDEIDSFESASQATYSLITALECPNAEGIIAKLLAKGAAILRLEENLINDAIRYKVSETYINILKEALAKREKEIPVSPMPKIIHFIWHGKPLPEKYKNTILEWSKMAQTSGYELILWTDDATLSNEQIQDELGRQAVKLRHWRDRPKAPEHAERDAHIDALVLDIIDQGNKPGHSPNYAACSDIERFAILEQLGGLYVDTDNSIVFSSDTPIGDINIITEIGARFIENRTGFNQCFIAALPHSKKMNEMLDYFAKCHAQGIGASPIINPEDIKAYPQYRTTNSSIDETDPMVIETEANLNSLAWWVTRQGYFHGVNHLMGKGGFGASALMAIRFCSTLTLTGPGVVRNYYKDFNFDEIQSTARSFPKTNITETRESLYLISGTEGSIVAADGQHGTWQIVEEAPAVAEELKMAEPVPVTSKETMQQQFIADLLHSRPMLMRQEIADGSFSALIRRMLVDRIDPDQCDSLGNTALHIACQNFDLETMRFLLQNGADPALKNSYNKTPLDYLNEAVDSTVNIEQLARARNLLKHLTPGKQGAMMAIQAYLDQREREGEYTNILRLGYSKTDKMAAAKALLDSFEGIALSTAHQEVLNNGRLATVYSQFEQAMAAQPLANDSSPDLNVCKELISFLQSKILIDPGAGFNRQNYPNLFNLKKELNTELPNFSMIQRIAVKGYAANCLAKQVNPARDQEQVNNRLSLFQAILGANSLEQALSNIKERIPGLASSQQTIAK